LTRDVKKKGSYWEFIVMKREDLEREGEPKWTFFEGLSKKILRKKSFPIGKKKTYQSKRKKDYPTL